MVILSDDYPSFHQTRVNAKFKILSILGARDSFVRFNGLEVQCPPGELNQVFERDQMLFGVDPGLVFISLASWHPALQLYTRPLQLLLKTVVKVYN